MKDAIKVIIKEFHSNALPEITFRAIDVPLDSRKIITISGVRRSGKTYLMYQLIKTLREKIPKENIIYINFEDERLDLKKENLQEIYDAYYELYPEGKLQYLFFDEIQNVENWEQFIRRSYDTITRNIFITGSSSKLLSKEIATSIRGRAINYEVYPFSFKEYLKFKNVDTIDLYSLKKKALLRKEFGNYLVNGGFPETIDMRDEVRRKTLQSYIEVMIYRDIISRYKITNTVAIRLIIKKLLNNIGKKFSVNKQYTELKSQGIKISKDSLYEYMNYLEDCYILFFVQKLDKSVLKQSISEKKAYSVDTGIVTLMTFDVQQIKAQLLENVVFLELKRQGKDVMYSQDKNECDFVINKDKLAIQVCLELNSENINRETNGIREAKKRWKLKKTIILTYDTEKEIIQGKTRIKVLPVWKWLLEK
ncbi:TPA: ATP-binding protein [Candidatus Woesearchaeota archaeon]|nr:hypothetical protein [uncultured archaeon]MBS3173001.1 ATP-binding protein [Candidatus Woesearchaeota archaeon]AQS32910.1 hypothetical protein [uncultured archaeon]AQS34610.1 hypothetical protein [uncultured archaeon]HIH31908.1 ATP-binding protein [Candidatus Woesearchaeota archaeon]